MRITVISSPAKRPARFALKVGYAFVRDADNEWDTEVYTPDGSEVYSRTERIDGSVCCVFRRKDGTEIAQTEIYCQG